MRANVVRIGNSQGLRLPKALLDACGIRDQVELRVEQGRLVIEPLHAVRDGWAEAAQAMSESGDDRVLDEETPTEFDATNWEW
ncbi:MAG TPA: AbrB/MazE/SpoVT family DNA-binding domain-containing protein [Chloroflexota bacterium]|nr:AbrB/MazE/SpoVT family DNA-binding domain-containing protein [Chloroflexota bacterium]